MAATKKKIRNWATAIAAVPLLYVFWPVVSEFFIKWAEQRGWYDDPQSTVDRAMNDFFSYADVWWVQWAALFGAGMICGLWVDVVLRRQDARVDKEQKETSSEMAIRSKTHNLICCSGVIVFTWKVESENQVDAQFIFFNSSDDELLIQSVEGSIEIEVQNGQLRFGKDGLPAPTMSQSTQTSRPMRQGQRFGVIIEQRLPGELARSFLEKAFEGNVVLRFEDLDIWAIPSSKGIERRRLPIWAAASISPNPEKLHSTESLTGRGSATVGPLITPMHEASAKPN